MSFHSFLSRLLVLLGVLFLVRPERGCGRQSCHVVLDKQFEACLTFSLLQSLDHGQVYARQ